MIVDVDGRLVPAEEARVSPFDGAYLYGDGVFETLRAYRGHLFALGAHLERMEREIDLLQLPVPTDSGFWKARIEALLEANALLDQDARVRLQVGRGGDAHHDALHAAPGELRASTFLVARPIPERIAVLQHEGARAITLPSAFARGNFPRVKSLNYLPSIMALRFARARGADEALALDGRQQVLEGAISNVFAVRAGALRTPAPRLGLLPGITRNLVMELAVSNGWTCVERLGEVRELLLADEAFLCNSIQEMVPLVQVDGTRIGDGRPGPVTRRLQELYRQRVEAERATGEVPPRPARSDQGS